MGADTIGHRIRAARTESRLSLRDLAAAAGLSPGFVSQVERGLTDPSMESLRRIAAALHVPMFDLFQDGSGNGPAVVRAGSRVSIQSPQGGITYSRITPGAGRLEVLEGLLEPGGLSSPDPWSHPSEECVVVQSGRLVVEVDGHRHTLDTGDSCSFNSRLPHRYLNESEDPVSFLLAITPPSY